MLIPLLFALQAVVFNAQNVERQPPIATWPVERIVDHCPEFHDSLTGVESCRVSGSGMFATFKGDRYYYAIYCVQEKGTDDWGSCSDADSEMNRLYSDANVAVFVHRGGVGTVRLLLSQLGLGGHFRQPRIGENSQGAIMELPYVSVPTCDCNSSTYYLWRPQTRSWDGMDWQSRKKELSRKLSSI